ncbi:MAG: glucose-6-phosphate isomerase [Halobacteriales archaeon]
MEVDLGGCLAPTAAPGISRETLERLDGDVAAAHERIKAGRDDSEFGYAALNLPRTVDLDAVRGAVAGFEEPGTVLTVGIGGSALGALTITEALDPDTPHYALDNVDPAHTRELLTELDLERTVIHVVSRSGTTAETLATFLVVREAMADAGVDWTARTVVTTGAMGPLRRLAEDHDLPVLSVPTGVPGRYAALSTVGLVPAALCGLDLDALIDGARSVAESLTGSLFKCPAYAYGAAAVALEREGARVHVKMPYAEPLERYAEWFAQLWAESLGKDGLGQVPGRALGATDQHSQLQRYRAGPADVLVGFVRPRERPSVPIPEPTDEALAYLGDSSLGELLDAELEATAASLAEAGRPHLLVEIERLDAFGLGELLYGMQAATVMAGELLGVNAFDQPAVEWAKAATRELLGEESTAATRAVDHRPRLWVPRPDRQD